MPQRFELIVFDWDGTLLNSAAIIASCIRDACRDFGLRVPSESEARYTIGMDIHRALAHITDGLAADDRERLRSIMRGYFIAREPTADLFDGAREMLTELRTRGHRLAVATGKTRLGLDRVLAAKALTEQFDATRCADEGRSKPDPEMLLWLMDKLQITAERTLMIGDTTFDLDMAHAAGVSALAVAYDGAHARDALQSRSPLAVMDSVSEVRQWLSLNA